MLELEEDVYKDEESVNENNNNEDPINKDYKIDKNAENMSIQQLWGKMLKW